MLIEAPAQFRQAAELFGSAAYVDPREPVSGDLVELDLRPCRFIRPPAVLWCTVFPLLLARTATRTVLLVPENPGVAQYLKGVGLFDVLRSGGVEVDDRGIPDRSSTWRYRHEGGGMVVVRVHDLVPLRVLAARRTARRISTPLEAAVRAGGGEVVVDFAGVAGLGPAFLDELLAVLTEASTRTGAALQRILIANPPTSLSSKFAAIGRGRSLHFDDHGDDGWEITPVAR